MRHAKIERFPWRPHYRLFSALWDAGEPGSWGVIRHWRLSPLGLAVRAHLLNQDTDHD